MGQLSDLFIKIETISYRTQVNRFVGTRQQPQAGISLW